MGTRNVIDPCPMLPELARRDFLKACASLALTSCSTLAANTRLAAELTNEPHPDQWGPVLRSLCSALLAFEDKRFPVSLETVEAQLLAMFPIDQASDFLALRKALIVFDDTALFPQQLAVLVTAERSALAAYDEPTASLTAAQVDQRLASDAQLYAAWRRPDMPSHFSAMPLALQRGYVSLWSQSAWLARRRFYRSCKTLIMVATYSLPASWQCIGYEGPLLHRG
jgi:hypothetical protein